MNLNVRKQLPIYLPKDENWGMDSLALQGMRHKYDPDFCRDSSDKSRAAMLMQNILRMEHKNTSKATMESYYLGEDDSSYMPFYNLRKLCENSLDQKETAGPSGTLKGMETSMDE